MSGPQFFTLEELIANLQDKQTYIMLVLASQAAVVYDILLTLPDEVKFIWKKRKNITSALYFLAHYGVFMGILLELVTINTNSTTDFSVCTRWNIVLALTNLITTFGRIGLTVVSAWTIVCKKRLYLYILSAMATLFIASVVATFGFTECVLSSSKLQSFFTLKVLNQVLLILFEFSVIVIILFHTWRLYLVTRNQEKAEVELLTILVKKGLLRFALIFVWNIADAIADKLVRQTIVDIDGALYEAISTILVCRFFLETCQFNAKMAEALEEQAQETEGQLSTNFIATHVTESYVHPVRRRKPDESFLDLTSHGWHTTFYVEQDEHHSEEFMTYGEGQDGMV